MIVDIKGLNIHYRVIEGGEPSLSANGRGLPANGRGLPAGRQVLILHGWGSKSENWQTVGKLLAGKGFQVIIPDLPGFGRSDKPENVWDVDNYVEFVNDFVSTLELRGFYLMGHSFGGTLAIKYTTRFFKKISKLILVSAACIRTQSFKKNILFRVSKIFKFLSFVPFLRKAFYRFIVRRSDYPHIEGIMKDIYLNVIKEDLSDILSDVNVPTMIIWGEKDNVTPLKQAHIINSKIKGSTLEIIPGAGHDLNIRRPGMLVDLIS